MEPLLQLRAPILGQGPHPLHQGLGFKQAHRHHLPAACPATCPAGDGKARTCGLFFSPAYDQVFQTLNNGQKLSQRGLARRHLNAGLEASPSNPQGKGGRRGGGF